MSLDYTQESLQLAVTEAVYANDAVLFMNDLLICLFGVADHANISNTLRSFVRHEYTNQLKGFVRHFGKKHIYKQLEAGSSVFIKRFEQQQSSHTLFSDIPRIQMRINCLLVKNAEGSLFNELSRYFIRFRNRFVPLQAEENFRLSLIEWIRSGEMTKAIHNELNHWFKDSAKLSNFKKINFPSSPARDTCKSKVIKAVQEIRTDEFIQLEIMKQSLSKFFAPTTMNIEVGKLRLFGRTIFLSDWIDGIVKKFSENSYLDVEIYVADCCGIDCGADLYGINLVICSNKVYVWQKHNIVLSGLTFKRVDS